ncbi:uncharacterized protein LOC136073932 [Hydra vulgaris]|uniref:uncharacterized protein LOC136073932 n=1 Tax=Hydra vulgaris TaxID=6087 RepID=UPI0032EA7A0A
MVLGVIASDGKKCPPVFVKKVCDEYIHLLQEKSIKSGKVPEILKIASVTLVFMSGDESDPSNYRPISVLSCFSKLLERIMYNRLYNHLTENNMLYSKQFGLKKQHSKDHVIIELVNHLSNAFKEVCFTLEVFIDLSKAFDTIRQLKVDLPVLPVPKETTRSTSISLILSVSVVGLSNFLEIPLSTTAGISCVSSLSEGSENINLNFCYSSHVHKLNSEDVEEVSAVSELKFKSREQAYDEVNVMLGAYGVQGKVKNVAPKAVYMHCYSHQLILAIAAFC